MAEIHIHTPSGETIVHSEDRVAELLKSGTITSDMLYWREGMPDWQPLAKLKLTRSQVILPEKRTVSLPAFSAQREPQPMEVPAAPVASIDPDKHATGRRRFRFRKNPEPLTTIVQVMLVVCMCVALFELANGLIHYNTIATQMPSFTPNPLVPQDGSAPAGAETSVSGTDSSPTGTDVATLVPQESDDMGYDLEYLGWATNILLIVPYFMWLFRTCQNCRHFSFIMRFKPVWAVGCYFVPVINFFRPCQVMQEIWRVSNNPRTWHNDRYSITVGIWWALTLGTGILACYSFFHSAGAMSHEQQVDAQLVFLILKVMQIAAYAVFLAMVTMIINKQIYAVRKSKARSEQGDETDA